MPGSGARIACAIVFNLIVAVVFRFFGASLPTCWFTFLLLLVFSAVAHVQLDIWEVDRHLNVVERKLDAASESQSNAWTDTIIRALARIEGKLDAIPSGE